MMPRAKVRVNEQCDVQHVTTMDFFLFDLYENTNIVISDLRERRIRKKQGHPLLELRL